MFLFVIIALFGGVGAMKRSEFTHVNREKDSQTNDVFRMLLQELIEKIPELEKEKYANILFDFLGPRRVFLSMDFLWYVDVPLDHITNATFECEKFGSSKVCTLKMVNNEYFDGDVQFYFSEDGNGRVEIYIRSLYVAECWPVISGALIVKLVKKMTDSRPNVVATLNDASNVKILAMLTTGQSYYEHLGFHYVNADGTKMIGERHNVQNTEINTSLLLSCISKKLDKRLQVSTSFVFREQRVRKEAVNWVKEGILGILRAEVGLDLRRLEDFWKIYRNVTKNVDFCSLQNQSNFKTHIFTRYLRECLLEQINVDEEVFRFSKFEEMIYP